MYNLLKLGVQGKPGSPRIWPKNFLGGMDGKAWNWLIHKHVWCYFLLSMFADRCVYTVCWKPQNFSLIPLNALVRPFELRWTSFIFFEAYIRTFEIRVSVWRKRNQNRWPTFPQTVYGCIIKPHKSLINIYFNLTTAMLRMFISISKAVFVWIVDNAYD